MTIQINTDHSLHGSASELNQTVTALLTRSLDRFSSELTRVEVHLGDENGVDKKGADDKRCVLEARLPGHAPLVVTHHAATVGQALDGGVDRLKRLLENTFDRRKNHR